MKFKTVKGMPDILPEQARRFQTLETRFQRLVELHGFEQVRTPLLESTALFQHSTGETTEVVEKQMFTLTRDRESLSLRPEGTPSCARAYIKASVHAKEPVTRWYYLGPMFRAENVQRGRQRQFHQAGCEIYGDPGPACDAELIDMLYGLLSGLGIEELSISLNSLGNRGSRRAYREALLGYLRPLAERMSPHARERFEENPLRVLDSKDERDRELALSAPSILEVLDAEDRAHLDGVTAALDAMGTPYEIDPRLVRGLDYYTRTTFEVSAKSGELGTQNALLGGGRYDDMLEALGGPPTPAIGFAMGLERILLAMPEVATEVPFSVTFAPLGPAALRRALVLSRTLRAQGIRAEVDGRGTSLKSMLRRANSAQARLCVVLGDSEMERGVCQLKDLREHEQIEIAQDSLLSEVNRILGQPSEAGA